MAKSSVKTSKSIRDGYVSVRVTGSAHRFGESVSSTVAVDLDLDTARAVKDELQTAIFKAEERMKAKADREARRKAWRDREVAAGRMKTVSFHR
jgi:hypothetical protein